MAQWRRFQTPGVVLFGAGAAGEAGVEAARVGARKCLVVTDENLVRLGHVETVASSLRQAGLPYVIHAGVNAEPSLDHIAAGLAVLRREGCDAVVAVGGGSPMDAAKGIAIMALNEGNLADYRGLGRIPRPGLPLLVVPTTAGTGSEATIYTIITDPESSVKMPIGSPYLLPAVSLVDPLLTLTLPPLWTAATGLDAMIHAMEAYVSRKAQPLSDVLALSALEMLYANLKAAVNNPDDLSARTLVMQGALQAGMAFSNSSIALIHGMSRPLGANFDIPHGLSNGLLLKAVFEYSLPASPERYARLAQVMGITRGDGAGEMALAGLNRLEEFIRELSLPRLSDLGLDQGTYVRKARQMAKDALASGSPANNPRQATEEEIEALYLALWEE
jgi:alcohol dehydrogenase